MSRFSFIKVSTANLPQLMRLTVRDDETHLIAPCDEWLAEAMFEADALSFGIYDGSAPVGLISVIDPRLIEDEEDRQHFQPEHLYVWRVMTDKAHRGQGCGKAAIAFARQIAAAMGLRGVSLTTMDLEQGNALDFYLRLGFAPTGRRLNGECELTCAVPTLDCPSG